MSYNIALLSVPAFYVLSLVPHMIGASIVVPAKTYDLSNPSGSTVQEKAKKKLSARDHARYERTRACHRNHLENMPLFTAAILAGVYAERETGQKLGISTIAVSFLAIRVLYTINYITVTSETWAYVRSVLYAIGVGLCFTSLIQSARALGASS